MFLALEEAPFVLQGPRPPVPPSAWESYGPMAVAALGLGLLAAYAFRYFLRQGPPPVAPATQLERELRAAEALPPGEAVAPAARALRAYLAAVEPRAGASLSTEELGRVLADLPVFLPARQPLLAALRAADAAKFGGATLELAPLLADIREGARRAEDARRAFAKPVVTPPIPSRPAAPAAPAERPEPPPLPTRDLA